MGAAAAWNGAAGTWPVAGGAGAGGVRKVWPGGRAAGGGGAGGRRRKWSLMWLEFELKRKRRQQGTHLRRSPDPAERRAGGAMITSLQVCVIHIKFLSEGRKSAEMWISVQKAESSSTNSKCE